MSTFSNILQLCLDYVLFVKAKMDAGELDVNSKPTLFQKLLMPGPNLGYVVPSPKDLSDEAYTVLGAAADTTGNALTTASWYICNNPTIYQKLTAELKQAFPDPDAKMDLVAFERLPHLVSLDNTFRIWKLMKKTDQYHQGGSQACLS